MNKKIIPALIIFASVATAVMSQHGTVAPIAPAVGDTVIVADTTHSDSTRIMRVVHTETNEWGG